MILTYSNRKIVIKISQDYYPPCDGQLQKTRDCLQLNERYCMFVYFITYMYAAKEKKRYACLIYTHA